MSLVDVQGMNLVPGITATISAAVGLFRTKLDAAGELCGGVFEIPKTGNISKIGIRAWNVSQSDTLKISLQTVDTATGRPTGTLIHADAYGTQASLSAGTAYWVSLQDDIAVTRGTKVAVVVEFNSYVAGDLEIVRSITNVGNTDFPYTFTFLGSVWALTNTIPNFGLEYDDGTIESISMMLPAAATSTISWDTNDNPDRRGLRFSVPYNCRMSGIFALLDLDADADIEIYDSDGVTIIPDSTISMDANLRGGTGGKYRYRNLVTPIELTKDTFYRIIIHPTTGTNIALYALDVTDDGASEAMNAIDGGINMHGTYCNGPPTVEANWTQEPTRRYLIGIILDQLDDGMPYNIVGGAVVVGQSTAGTVEGD